MSAVTQQPASVSARCDPAQALRRAALAVAHLGSEELFGDLVRQLAEDLGAAVAFIAVFEDAARQRMRTLAARMDGRPLRNFEYPLQGTPCAQVVGRAFLYVASGASVEFPKGSMFGAKGMDCYAAYPLNDSEGEPLGIIAAMDRAPIADPELAESLMKIFAVRVAAELDRPGVEGGGQRAAVGPFACLRGRGRGGGEGRDEDRQVGSTRYAGALITGPVGANSTVLRADQGDYGWMPEGMYILAAGNLWVSTEGHANLARSVFFVRMANVP